jgi:hypothetical protein
MQNQMNTPDPQFAATVAANEKMLTALIGLLALKDPHLLGEMRTIFAMAAAPGPAEGSPEARTWARVRHELDIITDMVEGDDEAPPIESHWA